MNEQEIRQKIIKVEKYNNQIMEEDKRIDNNLRGALITSILSIFLISSSHSFSPNEVAVYVSAALGGAGIPVALHFLKNMVTAISKKTNLESKVEYLNDEIFDFNYENNKSKGAR